MAHLPRYLALLSLLLAVGFVYPVAARTRAAGQEPQTDSLDQAILAEMEKHGIPGLSLAVLQDGKIVRAQGYGVGEKGAKDAVTPATLFQAGSVSKPVSAFGALRLVQQGRLSLDEDVNRYLTSWKVPENDFTKQKPVTLRGILSHTAGLTVSGFAGYEVGGPVPTLVQVLNGEKPANSDPIRVDIVPGSQWRYSGGGYTVMQQLVIDVTGKPFPQFMHETVLRPLGMNESTYEQPLPPALAKRTATGTSPGGKLVKGRWHVYPEMAAAGLWTTSSDLLRFAGGVENAYAGKPDAILSQSLAREMLTKQKDSFGLGVALQGSGPSLRFMHSGRDEGFDTLLMAYASKGLGTAIMINANDDSGAVIRILDQIAREYRWPDYQPLEKNQAG
jgi:CubicO group peptidase (beta-lactamase class C family)